MVIRKAVTYKDAGVNIDEADRAVSHIKKLAKKTFTDGVVTDIGAFGAAFRLSGWKRPVLVSSADGVGTKLKVAFLAEKHDTVGEDLVNHCVNDIGVLGATPLFFLDYFATGRLDAEVARGVVTGLSRGCRANGCALIGGETAEMPGMYDPNEYDLAGFIVGAVESGAMLNGSSVRPGDVLIGLPSNGLHTNGYSLARRLLFETAGYGVNTFLPELNSTVGEELLKVHRSYLKPIQALISKRLLKGAAHITGGGITDNTPRVLPRGLAAEVDTSTWPVPPIFELMRRLGKIPDDDYRRTFNLGIGMILIVGQRQVRAAGEALRAAGESEWHIIGHVVNARRGEKARVYYV